MTTRLRAKLLLTVALCLATLHGVAAAAPPTMLRWLPQTGALTDVRYDPARGLAYGSSNSACMVVVDMANPAAPWVRGWPVDSGGAPVSCSGVKLDRSGDVLAVAANAQGAYLFDAANPSAPVQIGRRTGATVRMIALGAARAYALEVGSVYQVRTLGLDGTPMGALTLPMGAYVDMTMCAGRVYVLGSTGYVAAIDVSNDAAPTLAASVTIAGTSSAKQIACDVTDVWVSRVRSSGSPTITRLDGSTLAATFDLSGAPIGLSGLWADGGMVYGASPGITGMVGRFPTLFSVSETATGEANAVAGAGDVMVTSYHTISSATQSGGFTSWSFGGAVSPTRTATAPPQNTATRTQTASVTRTATAATQNTATRTATPTAARGACWPCIEGCRAACE